MLNGRNLGFWKKAEEVVALAHAGKGIVVMPTGTGKTTQAPQALHGAGFTQNGVIFISVPKRILAVELAGRVAEEMGTDLGDLVGYQIRGESKWTNQTRILFLTEGMLRSKIRRNPMLRGVSVILFDEFHQRTLMSDFNVALVERAQAEGSTVAFLLMSATIDPTYLAQHFKCGVVDGSDLVTTYPIAERYVGKVDEYQMPDKVAETAADLIAENRTGNGLVFCDGKAAIAQVVESISKQQLKGVTVLPLHGDVVGEARHAPFAIRSGITITVATDIVETGATLPGITWVVDSGLAKEVGYDPISDVSSLKSRPVAQDRLWQRRGRCGRVANGTYVGMFSEENALARPERTQPEIFRVPLREVVLTIKALGLSRIGNPISLIDSPPKANWMQAKRQLQQLGLVTQTEEAEITILGEQAVQLACDPREATMLLESARVGCLSEMAIAIAASQGKGLLYFPRQGEVAWEAGRAHAQFKTSRNCDAWTSIEVVRAVENRSKHSLGAWCRDNFVSYSALRDVLQVKKQLIASMRSLGYSPDDLLGTEDQLRQALAVGLSDRVFLPAGSGWYYQDSDWSNRAVLGRESVVRAEGPIVVWEIIEVPTKRGGSLKIITSASTMPVR